MKVLTLTQPWATLVAIGAKRFETRSWSTGFSGTLAIHAGKGLGPVGGVSGLRELCASEPFRSVLTEAGFADPRDLPRGVIVCTTELVGCTEVCGYAIEPGGLGIRGAEYERDFGDFSPGRFAWVLRDVRPLHRKPEARGKLGLWEWDGELNPAEAIS
ncbi:MAG TPA: ASCH domain-containing protein [Solirubrobacterales bacterium]|nr:ASCH domain-containing protein [Solirubrobacterales bacterium]